MSEEFNPFDEKYNVTYADGTRRFDAQLESIRGILSAYVEKVTKRDELLRQLFAQTSEQLTDVNRLINSIALSIATNEVAKLRSELVDKGVLE